jgi:hypothetical protein
LAVAVFLAIVVLHLFPVDPSSFAPWFRRSTRLVGATIVMLWIAILVSPKVSNYVVVISTGTFFRWLGLLMLPLVVAAAKWVVEVDRRRNAWRVLARSMIVGVIVVGLFATLVKDRLQHSYDGNYSGFLLLSARTFDTNPLLNQRLDIRRSLLLPDNGGYDGQFMYFAVFDPFLRAFRTEPSMYGRVMDNPPYRYGRIGFSLLTRVLCGSRWPAYPAAMVWLILIGLFSVAVLLGWLAQIQEMSPAVGALVLLVPGFWSSIQSGLPEPIAAATLIAGFMCVSFNRPLGAGVFLALSLLVRETGVIAVACLILTMFVSRRPREAFLIAIIALTPIVIWRMYVGWVLFPEWGIHGFFYHPPTSRPFAGIMTLWRSIARGAYHPDAPELRAAMAFPLVLMGGLAVAAPLIWKAPNAVTLAAGLYALSAVSLAYESVWIAVGNAQRTTYELFIMLALAVLAIKAYPRWLRAVLIGFWIGAGAYVFWGAYDAPYIREAAFGPYL